MFLWLLTFYQTGPNGLFIFYQVFNLILQSADFQNKLIDYYHKLESFYKNNPKFFPDKQMQNNHIQEIEQSVIEAQNVIDKNKKIIKAIE